MQRNLEYLPTRRGLTPNLIVIEFISMGRLRRGQELVAVARPMSMLSRSACLHLLVVCSCIFNLVANYTVLVAALPFPAPNLQNCLSAVEGCCTPVLYAGEKNKFEFPTDLPIRIRPAAHLVDNDYIAKYQRATELMRALPDTDGRSFTNQYKLHCVYCDNQLYFDGHQYPLEIHQSWLFYPWHRLYLYFHERILAKLIDDDTFALPFWNWDNQSPEPPHGNVVPRVYSDTRSYSPDSINATSSLYDPDRNVCAQLPGMIVDFQNFSNCGAADEVRTTNAHIMYTHMVAGGVTPVLFHGQPYRFGDEGGIGQGVLEGVPHGTLHLWMNFKDMIRNKDSASDPIFFGHHGNVDRLWEIWKTLPGDFRKDISDPDYLDTEFAFYDEDGRIVVAIVKQALELDKLRYTYEEVPNPWVSEGAVGEESEAEWKFCREPISSPEDVARMIELAKPFKGPVNLTDVPQLTFKLRRKLNVSSDLQGEEILEIRGKVDYTEQLFVTAFAFLPEARADTSMGCAEYLGAFTLFPHIGMSENIPSDAVWRVGIRQKLELMHRDDLEHIVVTLTGLPNKKGILLTSAQVIYSTK